MVPNTTIESRSGTIVVEDQVLTITQSRIDCSYSLSSTSVSFDSDGGSGTVSMTSPEGCSWSASSTASWIDISSGGNGSGSSTLSFTVDANPAVESRVGSLIIGGEVFAITQDGIICTYSLSSSSVSFDSGSDSGTVGMTAPNGCAWTASSSESWITLAVVSGNGDGWISYSVAANPSIQSRSGTITVEGQVLTIAQEGIECTYSLSSGSASFDSGGGSGSIDLTSPTGCGWTASSSESWITISSGANGSGDGSVSFAVAANSTIQSRAGVVTVGGQLLTITQGGIDCTYSLSLQSASFDSGGGSSSVSVTSPDGCEWSASSNDSWITITVGAGGSGDGPVSFAVAANTSIQSRSGSVMVGGQAFTIAQEGIPCTYSLSSDSVSLDAEGGSGSVGLNSPDGCEWSASNGESWITINDGSSGSGDGSISFTAADNTTIFPRSGTITVEGQVFTITQGGIDCSYSLSSSAASFGADGGSSSVSVSLPDGCEWSASSSESWITIGSGASGSGDGVLSFSASPNSTIQSRSGTITVEGHVLTITQGGIDCTYSLSPTSASLGSEGGASSVGVTSPDGCEWSASSSENWITIGAGASGSGDGSVSVSVAANPTIQSRSGSIMVGGQAFAITQDGVTCSFSLSSSSASFDADSGTSSVSISSPDGCEWSASPSDSWIAINAGANGSGDSSVSFTVTANSTIESRSGTITVEGEVLTITQGGIDCTYSLSPGTVSLGSEGGSSSFGVSSPEGCEWSASSSESWITISSGGSGSGSGSVSFTVDGNATIQSRSGSIVAGGQVFTVTQDGISCTYTLSSSNLSLGSEGGLSSIGVSSPDDCEWSASSSDSWIIMGAGSSGSGSGTGTASFNVAVNDTIQSRSGTVVVEGQVLTLTQEGIDCTYSLTPISASFDPEGGSSAAIVTSPEGCEWSASASASWIGIGGGSGSGTGSISFSAASNESTQSRTAAITVAEQELTITQGGIDCSYSLSPGSASFGSDGGNASVNVTSPEGCEWSASASESWIIISPVSNGSGNGSVSFTVDANPTIQSRSGTIVVGGQVFAITQDGISCTYAMSLSSWSFDSEGGSSSVSVTSPEGCEWSASSSDGWIIIGAGASGSGSNDVSFTVGANGTIEPRSGTIEVEGQVLTVTQDGIDCTHSLSPTSVSFDPEGGSSTANVTSPEGCEWSASSSDSWITIGTGSNGSGEGSLSFTVGANTATEPRSGTITVEDRVLTITQSRIDCSLSLSSISVAFDSDGGEGSVDVTSPDGCNWSAFSGDSWIAVANGASANGNGSVFFLVDANSTIESRSGTITVEDEVLTITQSGADCSFSLSSDSVAFDSDGGEGSIGVLSPSGCGWSASTSESWITLVSESHGDGDGFVKFCSGRK